MTSRRTNRVGALDTRCVHSGAEPDAATGAIAPPIHLSTTFERDVDGGYARGYHYGREGTPNRTALESCVADLEGGVDAIAYASGLTASLAVFELLAAGDHVVAPRQGYFGVLRQLREIAAPRGVDVTFVDSTDSGAIAAAARPGTRLIWVETPANPQMSITDIAAVVSIARDCGALVACDNTFATPVCQRPIELGADIVMHSGTKYLGGHSDVLSGLLVVGRDAELGARLRERQHLTGAVLGPFDCWLLRRSINTLALRMRRQSANAMAIASVLANHPALERTLYPGLADHPGHAIAARQMRGGFGAMLSILVRGGRDAAMQAASRTRLFRRATSLGGVESLIEHRASIEGPASTTPPSLLRLSVGIEDADDLIADIVQGLG